MVEQSPQESRLLAAFRDFGRRVGPRHFASGRWFDHAVGAWLAHHRRVEPALDDPAARRARAEALTRRACVRCAVAGGATAATTTAAEVATQVDLRTALVTLPLAAATVTVEMAWRALAHLRLMTDLADLEGVELAADGPDVVVHLYALALQTVRHRAPDDPGRELVTRVLSLEREEASEAIGSRLLGESVLRNAVPLVSVATSSVVSWRLTARIGEFSRRYFAWRRLLDDAVRALLARRPELAEPLIGGLWFVFTADGQLTPEETALLAHLVGTSPDEARARLLDRFVTDETDWLQRLQGITDRSARARLMHALRVAAAVDGELPAPERRVLEQAAAHLRQPFSEAEVRALADQLAAA